MYKKLRVVARLLSVTLICLVMELLPVGSRLVHAANVAISVNGAQTFQTMDGFGVNINSASWKNGEVIPALDKLVDQNGSNLFRVVIDNTDWEATNDNSDPNTFNWSYYNPIYSSQKFQDLWSTIGYLNAKGITNNVIISFMGPGPAWMGGGTLTSANEDEFVEMSASMAYYARNTAHVQFGKFSPDNEPDNDCNEGICMTASVWADTMDRLSTKLDGLGMSDLKIVGPDTAQVANATGSYMNAMMAKPGLMSKVDHITLHSYDGDTANAANAIANSAYPNKNFWMTEFSYFYSSFGFLGQNASALMVWDGYDSVYNHRLKDGLTTPPNDAGNAPALLSYNTSNGTYAERKEFYQFSQIFKFIPAGSVRIGSSITGGVTTYAFKDPVSGRLTIVGNNANASSSTLNLSLNNVGGSPNAMSYYQTNSTSNLSQGADVTTAGGTGTVTVPANTIFTLTGLTTNDTQAPTVPTNFSATAASATQVNLSWTASTDNIGVTNYILKRGTTTLATQAGTSFADSTAAPNTTYTYSVYATDAAGNQSAAATASVTTPDIPDTTAPTTSITAPTNGKSLSGTAQTITATASDNVGVTKVEWYLDGVLQATDTTSPYSFTWNTTTATNANHVISSKAYDAAGNVGTSSDVTVAVDNIPPTIPTNFTATATSQTQVNLSWTASTDNVGVVAYVVFRGSTGLSIQAGTTFTDNGVAANTTYTYTVYAVDAPLNASPVASVTVTTPPPLADTQAPTVPGSLASTNTTATGTKLTWTSSTDNIGVTGYQVLRNGVAIATTTSLTYTDSGLTANTTYSYSVKAFDAAGNYSAGAGPLNVTTLPPPDTTAPTVSITAPTAGSTVTGTVNVTANAADNVGVAGVQFKLDGVALGTEDTTSPYSTSWNTATASNGTHVLTAVARDAAGNTTTSSSVSVTVSNTAVVIGTDITSIGHSTTPAATVATPNFTTTNANELLVAFVSVDGPSVGTQTTTVTGAGLTWTLRKRTNTRAGASEIWTASTTSILTAQKVTATLGTGPYVGSIVVVGFTNAQAGGATASANAATGAPTISLTTTKANSQVWAVGNDWDSATSRTVGANQTRVDQYLASVGDTFWVQKLTNPVPASGTAVTLNDTAPTTYRWNLAAIEIITKP